VTRYANAMLGIQGVGSSTSIRSSYEEMRRAGAAARARLVRAAAQEWDVPAAEVTVRNGIVRHAASGRESGFGALVERAATHPGVEDVALKAPADFRLIGNADLRRLDQTPKTTGAETYGLDVRREGMLFAVLARPPKFGATLRSVDLAPTLAIPGVEEAFETKMGVAVLATNSWAAMRGRDALVLDWDESGAETRSTEEIFADYRILADGPGVVAAEAEDAAGALAASDRIVEAEFTFPFLAHAPMEPLNVTIERTEDGAEVWMGCQFQTIDQGAIAGVLGLPPENVTLHTLMAGGSFGRRANPMADFAREAAHVVAGSRLGRPVQTMWTREDDLAGGYYRAQFLHRVRAALGPDGSISGWDHRVVGQSIGDGTPLEPYLVADSVDYTSVEGARENLYGVPNFRCDLHSPRSPVPVLWWRSVGHSHSTYAVETLMDDLAVLAGRDPLEFRLAHLADADPRLTAVLERAAEAAGWGAAPDGRHHGLAVTHSFGAYIAQVAEVSVNGDDRLNVHRMVAAIDCGTAINPDNIRAQVEGGIAFGMTGLFHGAITLDEGRVEQSNFDGYRLLRLSQMPEVETIIMPSTAPPAGVGEPPVPAVAPAISNAYFAATGRRIRDLPFDRAGVRT
ncbi:MAG: molybdopterin cofactor-binding domain-containing protein, partial [Pseudomonadota bacterium]